MRQETQTVTTELDERFRRLLDAAPDAMVIVDPQGRIVLVNTVAEALFGYARDALLGEHVEQLIPAGLRGDHPSHRARYVAAPRTRLMGAGGLALHGLRKDGTDFPAEISLSPLDIDGRTFVITAVRDVSERKRDEQAMLEAKQAVEAANRELESFSYSAAHDLRAPLRTILGFSEILQKNHASSLDPTGQRYLQRIAAAGERMTQIIDALLALSRVASTELRREDVDLVRLARPLADQLAETGPERNVTWIFPDELLVRGDPRLLRELLENLLGNAWKFTGRCDHATIELGEEQGPDGRVVFVRDNGAGFDASESEKLFAPFVRLHASSQFPGTGVGLATVRRIVTRHGGRIWAEGSPGEGATFRFVLPMLSLLGVL